MLLAAIDYHNPAGKYDVIVSAIAFDIWAKDILEDERMLMWEVYKRARIVASYPMPQEHQRGACWCCRMATEAAAILNADVLVHLADDVLLEVTIEKFVEALGEYDYCGSHWSGATNTVNTQVFACKVKAFANLQTRKFIFNPIHQYTLLENYIYNRLNDLGLTYYIWPDLHYFTTHHTERFFAKLHEGV
jgi:hypothetical protein